MQTETQATIETANTIKPQRDAAVDANAARAQQVRLDRIAADAQTAADQAQAVFKRAPSAASAVDRDVKAQLAINAREAAANHAEAIKPTLAAERLEQDAATLIALRVQGSIMQYIDGAATPRFIELFTAFRDGLSNELTVLARVLDEYAAIVPRLNALESRPEIGGTGERRAVINVPYAITRIASAVTLKLRDPRATATGFPNDWSTQLEWEGGNNSFLSTEVRLFPAAQLPPRVL